MERFKEENNGVGTTDICVLFSFWQTNFGLCEAGLGDEGNAGKYPEEKSWMNYHSKSFNNKTFLNNDRGA